MDFKLRMRIFFWHQIRFMFLGFALSLLFPFYSTADENDFKVDVVHTFPVVEKKATFNKYEGKFSQKPTGLSEKVFSGQKLVIERTGEWGGHLVYDGKPLAYKEKIEFNQLVFSPDRKVAIAFGTSNKPCVFFIDDGGNIIKKFDFSAWFAKASENGFVVLGSIPGNYKRNVPIQHFLIKFDFGGREIWRRELTEGGFSYIAPTKLSVAPNGQFIIISLDNKDKWPGTTRILNKDGNELERFSETYNSFFANDNETAVLVSRRHLRIVNVKEKNFLLKNDLDENKNNFYGLAQNNQNDKVVLTVGDGRRIDELMILDLKNKKITKLDAGSKDCNDKKVFYSDSENKVIFKSIGLKDYGGSESIDLEK